MQSFVGRPGPNDLCSNRFHQAGWSTIRSVTGSAIGWTQAAQGLRPWTHQEALPPGPPAKGEALCNLSIGYGMRGGRRRL